MSGKEENSIITERTTLVDIDCSIDRLSHELTFLISLGALSTEENDALTAFLEDLRGLWVSTRQTVAPAPADLHELSRLARLLAADLDLVYQRLSYAA